MPEALIDRHAPCIVFSRRRGGGIVAWLERRDAMRIGIIGAGMVGGALGKRWASLGHQVLFWRARSSRAQGEATPADAGPNACAGSVAEAAAFGSGGRPRGAMDAAHEAIQAAGI